MGHPRFHARQIFHWMHKRGVTDFAGDDRPRPRAARAARRARSASPRRSWSARERSSDGTTKFLLRLEDGQLIESVFIPDTPAKTFCLSTQVGCAMRCGFCLTGKMGIDPQPDRRRNRRPGARARRARSTCSHARFNIVLMGMGEPLHNYDATMKALRMLADEHGLAVNPRRVTLSTVGVLPALERLATEPLMPNLAISLHAHDRGAARPAGADQPQVRPEGAARRVPALPGEAARAASPSSTCMLKDVNDSDEDARRLVRLLNGIKAKVNLLPLNEAAGIPFERPSDARVNRFAQIVAERGVTVSVRKCRGRDIRAACGQLITESTRQPSPGQRLAALFSRRSDLKVGPGGSNAQRSPGYCAAAPAQFSPSDSCRSRPASRPRASGRAAPCRPAIARKRAARRRRCRAAARPRARTIAPWTLPGSPEASVPGRSEYGKTCRWVSGDAGR